MAGEEQEHPVGRQADATISVQEAARRLGKSADAIRSALRRKSLEGYRDNQGDWRVLVAALPPDGDRARDSSEQALDVLREELRQARDAAEQSQRQADDRQATVAELRVDLGRAEERIVARDDRIADLRRQLDREIARADRIEAELRRTWWDRLRELLRR